jgi:plastocyanin domain-containing protein
VVPTISIKVDHGFWPSALRATAGQPLRLAFTRLDPSDCASRVVFSDPRIERRLPLLSTTLIELPALHEGQLRFTCGMGRYSGCIEVMAPSQAPLARLRRVFVALRGSSREVVQP